MTIRTVMYCKLRMAPFKERQQQQSNQSPLENDLQVDPSKTGYYPGYSTCSGYYKPTQPKFN
jgi:hypothetical protein